MSLIMQRESTEYVYIGVTGDEPSGAVETAILGAGIRPTEPDWATAILVNDVHALWSDAQLSGVTGDYFVAQLVGPFNANPVDPGAGDYQVWIRLTDTDERPVRISPEALEIE